MALKKKTLSSQEVSGFCTQVALILSAGLPLYDGLETIAGSAEGTEYATLYHDLSRDFNETGSLYESLKKSGRWPHYMVEMTRVGTQTGQLEKVMDDLHEYYDRESRIRESIVSAVTYPMVLGATVVLIVLIMLWKVLPVFQRVLRSMGMEMTGSGRLFLRAGTVTGWVVLVIIGLFFLLVIAGAFLMRADAGDSVLAALQKVIRPVHRINMMLNASRVAEVLSMMLSGGFPTEEAFLLMPSILSDAETGEKVEGIRKKLDEGGNLADAITESGLFENLYNRMIRMGITAGREEQVMSTVAMIYEEQTEASIGRLIAVIEPTLIALLALVIGGILLSVMLPMAGILSGML